MKYVVVDLEFTDIPKSKPEIKAISKHEIIEIGAIMLDEKMNIVDAFSMFVKPEYSPLTPVCASLTGITNKDLENSLGFRDAIRLFSEWLSRDEYKIYTWSNNDKIQVERECRLKSMQKEFESLTKRRWIDLQRLYMRFSGINQNMQLERALTALDIETTGHLHRAIDDAKNTAEILRIMKNPAESAERFGAIHRFLEPDTSGQYSTLGDLFNLLITEE